MTVPDHKSRKDHLAKNDVLYGGFNLSIIIHQENKRNDHSCKSE